MVSEYWDNGGITFKQKGFSLVVNKKDIDLYIPYITKGILLMGFVEEVVSGKWTGLPESNR